MDKKLQIIISIGTIIGLIWGGIWAFSDKIATADDLKKLEQKTVKTFDMLQTGMDVKFKQQQLLILQDRKYRIKDEMKKDPNDPTLKQDYENINKDISNLESQILETNTKKVGE
jgi:hypothetical protein